MAIMKLTHGINIITAIVANSLQLNLAINTKLPATAAGMLQTIIISSSRFLMRPKITKLQLGPQYSSQHHVRTEQYITTLQCANSAVSLSVKWVWEVSWQSPLYNIITKLYGLKLINKTSCVCDDVSHLFSAGSLAVFKLHLRCCRRCATGLRILVMTHDTMDFSIPHDTL